MKASKKPQKYGFLLLPNYSMLGFSSAIETLHMANWVTGKELYRFCTISHEVREMPSNTGVITVSDHLTNDAPTDLDAVFVCASSPVTKNENITLENWLKKQAIKGVNLGGICTGSYLLAKAGLLDGYRATVHWRSIANLRDEFPQAIVSNHLFEVDKDRYTCSGGTAAMDMMLFLIGKQHGMTLASSISEQFVCERIRTHEDPQRIPLQARIGTGQPKLVEAVQLMEANIREPLSSDDIAYHVGVSRRQLERLFKQNLDIVPSRYYLELRLQHAKQLLIQTDKAITQVGIECGFGSAAHFSTTYKSFFDVTPRDERKLVANKKVVSVQSDRKRRQLWRK
ncbi:GlxA family transcriptional regulator [Marinomonas transparens]|uniref:GlxA family transcriptional regulator n=1 Tax=Marinomonas transparens TaxID=2795388 RepID=A0A934MVD5_9GAMM|nr:GlxA family transcriptional regulator [Marinomonas transparens]MBJ7536904.1 GlxA family transcriptional regulator [Marinomonas transparens]